MQINPPESAALENVFGSADGSTYSAVLSNAGGVFTVHSLSVDGHNVPAPGGSWTERDAAIQALEDIARGDRLP